MKRTPKDVCESILFWIEDADHCDFARNAGLDQVHPELSEWEAFKLGTEHAITYAKACISREMEVLEENSKDELGSQVKELSETYWNLIDEYEADRLMVADKALQRLIDGDDDIIMLLLEYKNIQAKQKAFVEIATYLDWILEGKELPDNE